MQTNKFSYQTLQQCTIDYLKSVTGKMSLSESLNHKELNELYNSQHPSKTFSKLYIVHNLYRWMSGVIHPMDCVRILDCVGGVK